MSDEKEILKELLLDESDVKKHLAELVKRAKNIFQISPDGKIIFKNFKDLKNTEKISAILIGKKFAKMLEIDVNESMTITDIGKELGIVSTTLSSPMGDLVKNGFVLKNEKQYEIAYNRLPEIFDMYFGDEKSNER